MLSALLYYIVLFYGLSPFRFDNSVPRAYESNSFTLTNLIAGSFFCILTTLLQSSYFTWTPDRPKVVSLVVAAMEASSLVVQNFIIFSIQFANRKELIRLINEGFDITAELKRICPQESIFSVRFRKYLRSKCFTKSVQITWLTVTTMLYVVTENHILNWIYGFAAVLVYLFPTVISSLYYCGSVLCSVRFYEILNAKITTLSAHLKTENQSNSCLQPELFCDVCDEIDYVAALYHRIASFVEHISERFTVQILTIQLTSFLATISAVKFVKISLLDRGQLHVSFIVLNTLGILLLLLVDGIL